MAFTDAFRNYALIDLDAMAHNMELTKQRFPDSLLMAVVKGNAYGHGIRGCISAMEPSADWYAVATVEEGVQLRQAGTQKPVLVLGPVPSGRLALAARNGLTLTLGSAAYAQRYAEILAQCGLAADCQIKLDTGLNRTGIAWRRGLEDRAMEEIRKIHALPGLRIVGTYTHLACPESEDLEDIAFTQMQLDLYQEACGAIAQAGLRVGLRHCCSTGSVLLLPHTRMDMVRTGMLCYGQCFSEEAILRYGLRPVLRWVSSIAQIREVRSGESVSYGRTYRAQADMRVAVVTTGYADGYRRSYSPGAKVILRGGYAPVVGRVCMDYLMVDVTHIPDAAVGDEVTLLGCQDGLFLSANALCDIAGSVSGEVTAAIASRVPRIYLRGGIIQETEVE